MLRIKEICKEQGITLQELSNRLNINYQSLHAVMTGNPTVETLQKMAATLNVSILELFEKQHFVINCPHCGKEVKVELKK